MILALLTTVAAKAMKPGMLCRDPWEAGNAAMSLTEAGVAFALAGPAALRRCAALLGTLLFPAAGLLLVGLEVAPRFGYTEFANAASCGCFGPVRLPLAGHLAVIVAFTAAFGWILADEERRSGVAAPPEPAPPGSSGGTTVP